MDLWSELEIETDILSEKCIWLALPCALSPLELKGFYVSLCCLCHYTKIDPVSLCHRIKYCCTPKQDWKLPSSSQDAPDSTSGLIISSNLYVLEIGEGSRVSSLWALGRLPHSGHSSPRHVMIHLCLLSHTEKDYFALDWCSICSHPFPAKVTISPKENKRCSELFINFCMWNEWGIDVRSPAVMRWWPRWDGMTQKQFLAMSN